jgi:biotin carboxyl carrier protein
MDLIARHGERQESVRVERNAGGFAVTVGDRRYHVDRAPAGRLESLLIEGRQCEVSVSTRGGNGYLVSTRRAGVMVDVTDPLTHLARAGARGAGGRKGQQVTAYMPGRVVTLLVKEGDAVGPGQGLVVLEAMKMENEIQAEQEGVVKRIFVEQGQTVEGGDPLFELE